MHAAILYLNAAGRRGFYAKPAAQMLNHGQQVAGIFIAANVGMKFL
jgi:hypothetical protein